jgi:hypothetical protein
VLTGRTRTCSFFPHSTAMTAFALVRKSTRAGLTGRVALLALVWSCDGYVGVGAYVGGSEGKEMHTFACVCTLQLLEHHCACALI